MRYIVIRHPAWCGEEGEGVNLNYHVIKDTQEDQILYHVSEAHGHDRQQLEKVAHTLEQLEHMS